MSWLNDNYNVTNLIVNILVALGTIGAVWVALWQTRKQYKVEIITSSMVGRVFGGVSNDIDYFIVSITNKGVRPITIEYLPSFYFSEKKEGKFCQAVMRIAPLDRTTIQPFTQQTFVLFEQKDFYKMIDQSENKFKKDKVKLFLLCSTGEAIEIKSFRKNKRKLFNIKSTVDKK